MSENKFQVLIDFGSLSKEVIDPVSGVVSCIDNNLVKVWVVMTDMYETRFFVKQGGGSDGLLALDLVPNHITAAPPLMTVVPELFYEMAQSFVKGLNTTKFGNKGITDGYHTFSELYEFRMLYNALLFNEWGQSGKFDVHKSWRHHDGEECFGGGWFIVVAVLPTGQISNHYKAEYWDLFDIPAVDKAKYEFDGHTPQDVVSRMKNLLKGKPLITDDWDAIMASDPDSCKLVERQESFRWIDSKRCAELNRPEVGKLGLNNMNPTTLEMITKEEAIARICHEANKLWCETNQDFSQKSWNEAEPWQRDSARKGVQFRLNNPDAKKDAQHNAWMEDKIANGWVYGEVKDAEKKTHPCIVPFEQLPEFQQKKDALFCAIVDALK